jgi:hypothetical protein
MPNPSVKATGTDDVEKTLERIAYRNKRHHSHRRQR